MITLIHLSFITADNPTSTKGRLNDLQATQLHSLQIVLRDQRVQPGVITLIYLNCTAPAKACYTNGGLLSHLRILQPR